MVTNIANPTETFNPVHVDVDTIVSHLKRWLTRQLDESGLGWFEKTLHQLSATPSEQNLFTQFSLAPRRVGKADLALTFEELSIASTLRSGWNPAHWSVDQAARTLILLSFPSTEGDRYVAAIEKLFSAADVAEQVALYQTLPLFPYPERFLNRAIDGLRNHINAVFDAIALHNPYPAEQFSEPAWNQMVLKALFIDSRLSCIQGIDTRANPTLAKMLSDYAHERWAAGRSVNPQLWRPLGPFADGELFEDLKRTLSSPEAFEQQAAALACASASTPEAKALLDTVPDLKQAIEAGTLTWAEFSKAHP
ncbi:MAG: EboA domain-containing protein [Leptolyngbyaceae bacterium]|nr:EboA domain-containing protein [Leptolyngbyaceae bacterium]